MYNPQCQNYDGKRYYVHDLIEHSKALKVEDVPIRWMQANDYCAPCEANLKSFAEHIKRVNDADLDYPIILAPDGFVLDGKHRLAKAISLGNKTIKAVQFSEMPDVGLDLE